VALTTVAKIKGYLGIPAANTSQDTWLTALQPAAEAVVSEFTGRRFESQNYTEFYNGNNRRELALRWRPVTAVASVYLDYAGAFGHNPSSPFPASTLLADGVSYVLDWDGPNAVQSRSGLLLRLNTVWPELPRSYSAPRSLTLDTGPLYGNIKVTYTAGYVTVPEDIQYAVAFLCSYMKRTIPQGGNVVEERIGDYSYALADGRRHEWQMPELATINQILSRYKEVALGWH